MPLSNDLPLPKSLQPLVDSGFWPTSEADMRAQNGRPLVSEAKVKSFAPHEQGMILIKVPFHSVADYIAGGEKWFWNQPMAAPHEIDHELTLIIADFGLGSDAPIALDYSQNRDEPRVIYLKWSDKGNHWVELAPNFDSFLTLILGN